MVLQVVENGAAQIRHSGIERFPPTSRGGKREQRPVGFVSELAGIVGTVLAVHVHVADQQALHPPRESCLAGKPPGREPCIDAVIVHLISIAHHGRMRGVVRPKAAVPGAHGHLCQCPLVAKRGNQHRPFARWSHMRVVVAEGLAEAGIVRRQAHVELRIFRLDRHDPLMFQHRHGTALLEFLLALQQQVFLLPRCYFRLFPLRRIGSRQVQDTVMVEARHLEDEASVPRRNVAINALQADVRPLPVLSMCVSAISVKSP